MTFYSLTIEFTTDDERLAAVVSNEACAVVDRAPGVELGECDLDPPVEPF